MKCDYCENKIENNDDVHFACDCCGKGMCEECFDCVVEHDQAIYDYHEAEEDEQKYEAVAKHIGVDTKRSYIGYLRYDCLDRILKEINYK